MSEIGTYQWNQKSRGFLSRKEKFRIVGMLVKAQVNNFVQRSRYMLGWSKEALARIDFDLIIRPDSSASPNMALKPNCSATVPTWISSDCDITASPPKPFNACINFIPESSSCPKY